MDENIDVLCSSRLLTGAVIQAVTQDVRIDVDSGNVVLDIEGGGFLPSPGGRIQMIVGSGSEIHVYGNGFNYPPGLITDTEGTLTCTGAYVVTLEDVNAGAVSNEASASALGSASAPRRLCLTDLKNQNP